MGLFRKKKEEPAQQETIYTPKDENNWREWMGMADNYLGDLNIHRAIESWIHAMEHFDDTDATYTRIHREISEKIVRCAMQYIKLKHTIPAHEIIELDMKCTEKFPQVNTYLLSNDLFYHMKTHYEEAENPEEMARMFITAAYAALGYLRFVTDIKAAADKCEETYKFGGQVWSICTKYGNSRTDFELRISLQFVTNIGKFFDRLQKALKEASDGLSYEECTAIAEYRKERNEDGLTPLFNGLQYAIYSDGIRHMNKKKAEAGISESVSKYVALFKKE